MDTTLNIDSNYSKNQEEAKSSLSKKLNAISGLFEKIIELENLIIKNIYDDYLNLIKIRENRTKIEKLEGNDSYINEYFLQISNEIDKKLNSTIKEWNDNNDISVEEIHEQINKLKEIKKHLLTLDSSQSFINNCRDILDSFASFKLYKAITLENSLDKIKLLLSFKDEFINNSEQATKKLSIDDL